MMTRKLPVFAVLGLRASTLAVETIAFVDSKCENGELEAIKLFKHYCVHSSSYPYSNYYLMQYSFPLGSMCIESVTLCSKMCSDYYVDSNTPF